MASTQRVAITLTLTYVSSSGAIVPVANTSGITVNNQSGGAASVYNVITGGTPVPSIETDAAGNLGAYFVAEGSYIVGVPASSGTYPAFNVYYEAVHGAGVGNLSPAVANLTGDVSGTLPNIVVNTIGGQTPVTTSTVLGGILSGSLPNPSLPSAIQMQLVPSGTIIEHAGFVAPAGYLAADHNSYPQTQYPTLFDAITASDIATFGSGVNSITFADTNLLSLFQGVLATSLASGTVYATTSPVSNGIPVAGPGINNGTNITQVELTTSNQIVITLSQNTTAAETNATVVVGPYGVSYSASPSPVWNFNVPDKRGRSSVGAGVGTGSRSILWIQGSSPIGNIPGGEATHIQQPQELVSHTHHVGGLTHSHGGGTVGAYTGINGTNASVIPGPGNASINLAACSSAYNIGPWGFAGGSEGQAPTPQANGTPNNQVWLATNGNHLHTINDPGHAHTINGDLTGSYITTSPDAPAGSASPMNIVGPVTVSNFYIKI